MDEVTPPISGESVPSRGRRSAPPAGPRMLAAGNMYSAKPVIRMEILPGDGLPEEYSADWLRKLAAGLPVMREETFDFPAWKLVREADSAIPAPVAVELLALLLQRSMGWPVGFMLGPQAPRRAGPQPDERPRVVVFETRQRASGLAAGRLAIDLCKRLEQADESEAGAILSRAFRTFRRRTAAGTPNPQAMWIAKRAERRNIPWSPLADNNFLRLGRGRYAEMLRGFDTSLTSTVASNLAKRKDVAQGLLAAARLPVPRQRAVRSADAAVAAAQAIGYPVVVKPRDGSRGRAVAVGLTSDNEVAEAFAEAQKISRAVVVESLIPGDTFRISVIGGKLFAAALRHPPRVKGDGVHSIDELVAQENTNPERQRGGSMQPIVLDDEMLALLAEQGLSPASVPQAGRWVMLRRVPNPPYGDKTDVTDSVHPTIRAMVERVAAVLETSICGIDFVTTDITRPWQETGGAICEVNTLPDLGVHLRVSEGTPRDGARAVINMLYPRGRQTGFPIIVVLREQSDNDVEGTLRAAWEGRGYTVGVASALTGARGASAAVFARRLRALDLDPDLDLGIVVLSPRQLVESGLGYDAVDLAIAPGGQADTGTARRARRAIDRVARGRVLALDDPDLAQRSFEVLEPRRKPRAPRASARPVEALPAGRAGPTGIEAATIPA